MEQFATKHPASVTFGLLFGATVWGIIWYPYRLLEQAGVSGALASGLTYAVALLLGILLFTPRRPHSALGCPQVMLPLALAAGWTNLSYVLAVINGEVMRVMLLFYLSPLWTLFLARLLLGERAGGRGLAVIALSLGGAFIMLWNSVDGLPLPRDTAEWLGLSSGIGFALTNVLTRRATALTLQQKSFAVWLGVTVLALLFLPFESAPLPAPGQVGLQQWLWVVGLGAVLMITTLLVQYGVSNTRATRAAVIFLFELVVAAVTAWWLAGEALSAREWVGGAMIILAALFAPASEKQ